MVQCEFVRLNGCFLVALDAVDRLGSFHAFDMFVADLLPRSLAFYEHDVFDFMGPASLKELLSA